MVNTAVFLVIENDKIKQGSILEISRWSGNSRQSATANSYYFYYLLSQVWRKVKSETHPDAKTLVRK